MGDDGFWGFPEASGKRRLEDRAFKYPADGAGALPEVSLAGRGLSDSTPRGEGGEPYWGPSLRTLVIGADLWPPEPDDPQPLPSASSPSAILVPNARPASVGPSGQRRGGGPISHPAALPARSLTCLPLWAGFQFPSTEVAQTLFVFCPGITKGGPRFSLAGAAASSRLCATRGCRQGPRSPTALW